MNVNVVSYAGLTHSFENAAVNQWVSQDWSAYAGISFWLYGNNSGTTLFVDVLDNRNPGSTKDDAERFSVDFKDNFSGWKQIEIPFDSLHRKEIGNGAPNDGLGLTEVHGWAFGAVTTPAPQIYYLDDVSLYGTAPVRPLTVGFSTIDFKVIEGAAATVTAKLSKPSADPVTVNYTTKLGNAVPDRDYVPQAGILTFPPNVTLQSFTVPTIDDTKYQGERGVLVELSAPTGGAALGLPPVARVAIQDNEAYDPTLLDDFETYPLSVVGRQEGHARQPRDRGRFRPGAARDRAPIEHVLAVGQKNGAGAYEFGRTFPTGPGLERLRRSELLVVRPEQRPGRSRSSSPTTRPRRAGRPLAVEAGLERRVRRQGRQRCPTPASGATRSATAPSTASPAGATTSCEYYTNNTDNVATDGQGNLVITVKKADGSLQCYYGPCQYTSARLLTKNRFEVAYGRVEARVKVPRGAGLWPAFWMLGTDIDRVGWPQTGEIDIMEHVGPPAQRGLRHHPRPGLFGRAELRQQLRPGQAGRRRLPHLCRRMAAGQDRLVPSTAFPITRRRRATPSCRASSGSSTIRSSCCSTSPSAATLAAPSAPTRPSRRPRSSITCASTRRRPQPVEFKASFRDNFSGLAEGLRALRRLSRYERRRWT